MDKVSRQDKVQLLAEVAAKQVAGSVSKKLRKARTLSLDNEGFTALQKYALENGVTVSELVDTLIAQFLRVAAKRDRP